MALPATSSSPEALFRASDAPTLSFPAILRNPGLSSRFAHLLPPSERPKTRTKSESTSARDKEGKRRVRRRENAKFTSNPHIVLPTKRDYSVIANPAKRTFPEPIPNYLRNSQTPPQLPPLNDPSSTKAGQFTLPLRGVRKELRRSGPRAERLVRDVETALLSWLETGDIVLFAASGVVRDSAPDGGSFNGLGPIRELERSPARLIWSIEDDAFARYIVHCVCRWYSVVSYSKAGGAEDSSPRLTYILRPNPSRLNTAAGPLHHALDTPPTTDFDSASSAAVESASEPETHLSSDFDQDGDSDIDDGRSDSGSSSLMHSIPDMHDAVLVPPITQHALPTRSTLGSYVIVPTQALQSLTLDGNEDHDTTDDVDATPRPPRAARRVQRAAAAGRATRRSLSRSSPSRSPSVRRLPGGALPSRRPRVSGISAGGPAAEARTLWSFVYE